MGVLPVLRISLLGEFKLVEGDKPFTTINTPRLQALIAYLLLHRAAPQPRQHIAFLFWPDSSEEQAHSNLRNLLSALRSAFTDVERYISIERRSLQWRIHSPFALDVMEFEQRLAMAEQMVPVARQAPDNLFGTDNNLSARSSAKLQEAVDLYTGDLLPACYDEWVLAPRERLRQGFLWALAALVSALEVEGDSNTAALYAQRLLRHDPLQEENYRRLMRLHLGMADRAGVINVYRQCERVLRRELGVEPSDATRQLLRGAEELLSDVAGEKRGTRDRRRGRARVPGNLPAQTAAFIGREREVAEISKQLRQPGRRLVTLTGTAGTGKTRLAVQVASGLGEFKDGVFFVSLASLTEPEMVERSIAQALGVTESAGRPLRNSLLDALRDKHILLVLDNFEHLLTAAAVVAELLASCPHLKVLATSRAPLNLRGEHEHALLPMSVPSRAVPHEPDDLAQYEAVALFVERALEAFPRFALTTENARAVAEICRRLEGLPLAIELAAARIKALSPEAILSRLDRRLKLLVGGKLDLPSRQRALETAIAWSYNLLDDEEKRLFRGLSVFAGGCLLEAAEEVLGVEDTNSERQSLLRRQDILDLITSLLNKSLLTRTEAPGGEDRFSMLETLRDYANERLVEAGEIESVQRRHSLYYTQLAEAIDPNLVGPNQALEQVRAEYSNFTAALNWALEHDMADDAATLGIELMGFWFVRGYTIEGARWLDLVLAKSDRLSKPLRRRVLAHAGGLAEAMGDFAKAASLQEEGVTISRELGDTSAIADALWFAAFGAMLRGDFERAESAWREALPLCENLGRELGVAACRISQAIITLYRGNSEMAGRYFDAGISTVTKLKDEQALVLSLALYGHALLSQGDYSQAETLLREGLLRSQQLGDRRNIADCITGLGVITAGRGDAGKAARLLGAAEALFNVAGAALWPLHRAHYERAVASVQAQLGEPKFDVDWQLGLAMTPEQAVSVALES